MAEAGILREDERVELLDGDVVEMSPVGDRHVEAVNRCERAFARALGGRAACAAAPRTPSGSAPTTSRSRTSRSSPPGVVGAPRLGEILLAIEVADTSVADDRRDKVPLYARAGVPETWLLNVVEGELEVYREPGPDGYARTFTRRPEQQVACEAFPDVVLRVADLLPPPGMERFMEREAAAERAADRTREQGRER